MRTRRIKLAVVGVILLGVLWFISADARERFRFYRFDSSLWKASRPDQRYYMAKYLTDESMVFGRSHEEVVAMLGEPDQQTLGMMLYRLAPARGSFFSSIDDGWLDLRLEAENGHFKVLSARIRSD